MTYSPNLSFWRSRQHHLQASEQVLTALIFSQLRKPQLIKEPLPLRHNRFCLRCELEISCNVLTQIVTPPAIPSNGSPRSTFRSGGSSSPRRSPARIGSSRTIFERAYAPHRRPPQYRAHLLPCPHIPATTSRPHLLILYLLLSQDNRTRSLVGILPPALPR